MSIRRLNGSSSLVAIDVATSDGTRQRLGAAGVTAFNLQGVAPGGASYIAILNNQAGYTNNTDLFSIYNPAAAAAPKLIQVRVMGILIQSTTATLIAFKWAKRTSLNTGVTSTLLTPAKMDSNDPAPNGVAQVYTAAPTIVDTTAPIIAYQEALTATLTAAPAVFNTSSGGAFGLLPALTNDIAELLTLRPGEELAMNYKDAVLNDGTAQTSLPSGNKFTAIVQWTERPL